MKRESFVLLPDKAQVLSVGLDPAGQTCFWAIVNPERPKIRRRLFAIYTGEKFPDASLSKCDYIGQIQYNSLVYHIFIY